MSILDKNFVDKVSKEAQDGLYKLTARQSITLSFTEPYSLLRTMEEIQNWIINHWAFSVNPTEITLNDVLPNMHFYDFDEDDKIYINEGRPRPILTIPDDPVNPWASDSFTSYYFILREFENNLSDDIKIGCGSVLIDTPLPHPYITMFEHFDDGRPGKLIYGDDAAKLLKMNTRDYFKVHNTISFHLSYNTQAQPVTLILKDVDQVPQFMYRVDKNGMHHWVIPIDHIYFSNSNIQEDILNLPYVDRLEDLGLTV